MKKYLIIVLLFVILLMTACSSGTNSKKLLSEMTGNEQINTVRENLKTYCHDKGGVVVNAFFMAFNREYINREMPNNGAFENLKILSDSIKVNGLKVENYGKRKNPIAEVSLMLCSSQKKYKTYKNYGNVGLYTGIDFVIDEYGNVLSYKGYTQFENDFLYYTDEDHFDLSSLFMN